MIRYPMLPARILLFILMTLPSFAAEAVSGIAAFPLPENHAPVFFHGDVHQQIKRLTKLIKKDRKNPELYFQRAVLYHEHDEFRHARNDYHKAVKLGYKKPDVYYFLARLYKEWNENAEALKNIDIFLGLQRESVSGIVERGRILNQMKNYSAALTEYEKAFKLKNNLIPEYYLEATGVILKRDTKDYDEALQMLGRAIADLGALSVFQDMALDLELKKGDVDAALARLDAQAENLDRKENHYARRADILAAAGRTEAAREYYRKALEAIEKLPGHRQKTPSVVELKGKIITSLNTLNH